MDDLVAVWYCVNVLISQLPQLILVRVGHVPLCVQEENTQSIWFIIGRNTRGSAKIYLNVHSTRVSVNNLPIEIIAVSVHV